MKPSVFEYLHVYNVHGTWVGVRNKDRVLVCKLLGLSSLKPLADLRLLKLGKLLKPVGPYY